MKQTKKGPFVMWMAASSWREGERGARRREVSPKLAKQKMRENAQGCEQNGVASPFEKIFGCHIPGIIHQNQQLVSLCVVAPPLSFTMLTRFTVARIAPLVGRATVAARFQSTLASTLKGMVGRNFISIDELRQVLYSCVLGVYLFCEGPRSAQSFGMQVSEICRSSCGVFICGGGVCILRETREWRTLRILSYR